MVIRIIVAAAAVAGVVSATAAGEPCGTCKPSGGPRIVVHVPPPEVVIQPATDCAVKPRCRLLHHRCGDRCNAAQAPASVTAALLSPTMTQTYSSLTTFGSLGLPSAGFTPFAAPGFTFGAAPIVPAGYNFQPDSGVHDFQRALRAFEERAGEFRSMMAQLDQARANLSLPASAAAPAAAQKDMNKELVASLDLARTTTEGFGKEVTKLSAKIDKLQEQVFELSKLVNEIDVRTKK